MAKSAAKQEPKYDEMLMKYAEEHNDARLMKVACGKGSIWDYLTGYIKENGLGELPIDQKTKRTIETSFNNNAKRHKQLEKWMRDELKIEGKSDVQVLIGELYKKEEALLDEYAYSILCDFLGVH